MGIKLSNISKSFGKTQALKDVSLEINNGDFATFLAPTGSGKTTLLRIIAGLEKVDSGKIYFDDKDVTDLTVKERDIAMVYQDFINYPSLSVYENIASPLRVAKKMSEKEIDKKVKEVAEFLNILEVLEHKPDAISGGQRQRTAIARALIKDVKYILLDEPLANLDYKLREELRTQLKEIFFEKSGAVIYATADPLDALALSSHVGSLHQGELLQFGDALEVYNNPKHIEVAKYFSYPTLNVFEGNLVTEEGNTYLKIEDNLKLNVNRIKDKLNKNKYLLGIRPSNLSLKPVNNGDELSINGTIELAEIVGSDTELHISYQGIRMIILLSSIKKYHIGELIKVYFDPNEFYIFDKDSKEIVTKMGVKSNGSN